MNDSGRLRSRLAALRDRTVTFATRPSSARTATVAGVGGLAVSLVVVAATGPWSGGYRTADEDQSESQSKVAASKPVPFRPAAAAVLQPATDAQATSIEAAVIAKLLAPLVKSTLGADVGLAVADPATVAAGGKLIYGNGSDQAFAPASTAKLATSTAALVVLGGGKTLRTKVVQGSAPDHIVLVGGGDPTLATTPSTDPAFQPASLDELAARTAAALRAEGRTSVQLDYDTSLFTGPALQPSWSPGYTDGNVTPVTALEADEGRTNPADPLSPRQKDPARAAATAFAARLAAHGITVVGAPNPGQAPAPATKSTSSPSPTSTVTAKPAGTTLAYVDSPPVSSLVEYLLTVSDNDLAEALARQVAIATGHPASFAGAADAITATLAGLGVPAGEVHLVDGSGLSRDDRLTPAAEVRILGVDASGTRPQLRPVLTGLPVAGFTGTLDEDGRFTDPSVTAGVGLVRAKTGTLTGVDALAGLVRDASGRVLVFSFIANGPMDINASRAGLDQLATALAGCVC